MWTAILLYQVADEAKAFLVIRNGMRKLLPNELLVVLALGWILESFLQGITGFGVPVAVGAPLLIGIGVTPLYAVIIPLLGQAWGNTFGTLAAAWDALAMSVNLAPGTSDYLASAFWAGLFIWMWNVVTGLVLCWFYGKGKGVKKGLPACADLVGDPRRRRTASDSGEYDDILLPAILYLSGCPVPNRKNEDVQGRMEPEDTARS